MAFLAGMMGGAGAAGAGAGAATTTGAGLGLSSLIKDQATGQQGKDNAAGAQQNVAQQMGLGQSQRPQFDLWSLISS